MPEQRTSNLRVRPLRFVDNTIDCPACGPGMTAHLVIRESSSGIAAAACLVCRHLYPVEMTGRRSGRTSERAGPAQQTTPSPPAP